MAFPSSIDTFNGTTAQGTSTLASPDHALDHRTLGSAVGTVEAILGTNAGTGILKNFAAGDFPARINSSNVLQQRVSGTVDSAILGTPSISGGTANNQVVGTPAITGGTINTVVAGTPTITGGAMNSGTFGTPTFTLASDATGDLFYRSTGGTVTRLAIGANQKVLTTNGTTPSWSTTITQSGSLTFAFATAKSIDGTITFPTAFSGVPIVVASASGTGALIGNFNAEVYNLTAGSCVIRLRDIDDTARTGTITAHWIAIGAV